MRKCPCKTLIFMDVGVILVHYCLSCSLTPFACCFFARRSIEDGGAAFDKAALEHRVKPFKYYPDVWMMHSELMSEVVKPTDHLVNLTSRAGLGEAAVAKRIGLVKVELLGAYGLPKLDRFGKTDLYAIMIVGGNVFRTDTIDDNYSPVFLPRTKRGAIFPLYVPYEQLYVGGFDDDGDYLSDDFVGRVSVDLSRLKPHVSYDITLKMRESDTMYSRKAKGAIRLR